MEILGCPTCDAPAAVARQAPPGSVHRSWDHVFVSCARGHWFLVPADVLPRAA